MGRLKNDGLGRLGGRQKGTPNKINGELKEWITQIINDGKNQFIDDLMLLEPKERIKTYMALLNYVLPKQQAIAVESEQEIIDTPITIVVESNEQAKEMEVLMEALRNK